MILLFVGAIPKTVRAELVEAFHGSSMMNLKNVFYFVLGCLSLIALLMSWWLCPFFKRSPEWISAFAALASSIGVIFVWLQLKTAKNIAQLQFEDGLAKEYRELASRIPTKALLGARLSPKEYKAAFDELFHYIDLSNEQCMLRKHGRVRKDVWDNWGDGIEANLNLPAFAKAWNDIKNRTGSFRELRDLEKDFKKDPFRGGPFAWRKTGNR